MHKKITSLLLAILIITGGSMSMASPASAHRSGCHRWHSCPSDTGAYVCGDLGYTSGCPVVTKTVFVGYPTTRAELMRCKVVGNRNSYIYHLKGSQHIATMSVSRKKCFANEKSAIKEGYRKSKTR